MSNPIIARVAIESPLPQLDRLFDYSIAPELIGQLAPGQRVKVSFGRSKTKLSGFVVEVSDSSEHTGTLSIVEELVSTASVLRPNIYQLCRQIADRQNTSISDVLRLAVPNRSVAVEKKWLAQQAERFSIEASTSGHIDDAAPPTSVPDRTTALIRPVTDQEPEWINQLVNRAVKFLSNGLSTIICVPDLADIKAVETVAAAITPEFTVMHSELKGSASYSAFLRCLEAKPTIVIGNRNALFAPVSNLGQILMFDEGDHSHIQQQSPYIHSRDIALMRQHLDGCSIHFAAHVRSAEIARLLAIGYLTDVTENFAPPKIATSESTARFDTAGWLAVREASKLGPVLVQVAAKGNSVSLYCSTCSARALCSDCHGPLWVNDKNQNSCRWCSRISLDVRCQECGSQKFKQGRAGATRTSAEIGRIFPGLQIVVSSGSERLLRVDSKPKVVVSTPGAEPIADGGYQAVVILDSDQLLRRDTMRANEDAVRAWSNAIALMSPIGRAVIIGLTGKLATDLSLWNQAEIAQREFESRIELGLPPALRVATITADRGRLDECALALKELNEVEVFGPATRFDELRLLIKFSYKSAAAVGSALKVLTLSASAGGAALNQKSGRSQRALKIKIDDPEVI